MLAKVLRGMEACTPVVVWARGTAARGRLEPAGTLSCSLLYAGNCMADSRPLDQRTTAPPLLHTHQQQAELAGEVGSGWAQPSGLHSDDSEGGRVRAICLRVLVNLNIKQGGRGSWQQRERSWVPAS